MTVIPYEHVHIPTLVKLQAARNPAPAPYVPQPRDVVEWEPIERVEQITLPSELEG